MSRANRRCECGSGKKSRNCECANREPSDRVDPRRGRFPTQVRTGEERLGLPGSHQTFLIQFIKASEPVPPHAGVGPFEVTVVLGTTEAASQDAGGVDLRTDRGGDSMLIVPRGSKLADPVIELWAEEPCEPPLSAPATLSSVPRAELKFVGYRNERGRLARLVVRQVAATSAAGARARVVAAARVVLARWSFMLDRPFRIARVVVGCETTKCLTINARTPYVPTERVPATSGSTPAELSIALDYYAEALAASSPIFEFLCFYKAAEVLRRYRGEIQAKLRAAKLPPLDDHRFSDEADAELWGEDLARLAPRTFRDVVADELRLMRNRVAHAFLDEDETPLVNPAELERVSDDARRWSSVARFVVRTWADELLLRAAEEDSRFRS